MAAPRDYPSHWEADVVVSDGGVVHIRPISPEDAEGLVSLHSRLSSETIYLRFFSPRPTLSPRDVERFTTVDYWDRAALVATVGGELIGVARYDRMPGTEEAEVAFVVEDAHQGRGVGTVLLEHLAAVARERGISRFVAETLPGNQRMLRVFHDAGYEAKDRYDEGVIRVEFPIAPTEEAFATFERREHRAESRSIERLLRPRTVAVIGASRNPSSVGHQVFRNILASDFDGTVYPVNPTASHIASVRAYPSVLDVPDDVDLAVVVTPAATVPDVARECAAKRVRGLVVLSAGFAETGPAGAALERDALETARANGMRLIGPNCIGVVNTAVGLNATFAPVAPTRGRVAFLSQSGALGIAILRWTSRLGLGVSTFVSVGNKADVSGNDLLQYWEDDDDTDVVLLYLESFGNPRKFNRLARRVSARKPIVAVKAGRTTAGTRAAREHTAAVATPDVAVDALFRQTGVVRVETLGELFDVAQLLASQPLPKGRRVAIVGNAGGPGILAADACEGDGLEVVELGAETRDYLRDLLGPNAAVTNPVDLAADAGPAEYELAATAVLDDEAVDAVIVVFTPPVSGGADDVADAIARVSARAIKPLVATFLAEDEPRACLRFGPEGSAVPTYPSPEPAAKALARAVAYAEWRSRDPGTVPELTDVDVDGARRIVDEALAGREAGVTWLEPDRAHALLRAYGIPVATTLVAATADQAVAAAEQLGYPVALKAGTADIPHRSDVGGVRLQLTDATAVRDAFVDMQAELGDGMGGAAVQAMMAPGVEVVVGVDDDPSFGPLVRFGMGGFGAELQGDAVRRVVPLTDVDAGDMVRALRSSPLLFGYRGTPRADVDRLADLLVRVGRLADDVPEIDAVELDPVIASPHGVTVVDAKVCLAPVPASAEAMTRRLRPAARPDGQESAPSSAQSVANASSRDSGRRG